MTSAGSEILENIRAALSPHGIFLRGVLSFDGEGPLLKTGTVAKTLILLGNIGGSIWPSFSRWQQGAGRDVEEPLDSWSVSLIRPLADQFCGQAFFPSERPWQPFQQWAMLAEGLKPSPTGILIHPDYGLWHGYRGAIAFEQAFDLAKRVPKHHPCDSCVAKPCLSTCPVGAISETEFGYVQCRSHLASEAGKIGCMNSGCVARNACPVGADYRYPNEQLRFHMQALQIL